ncbi:glycoside hydrolase family 16 protein [Colletotrichum karsti]|uniref:Glycoside hydrolase family 16 protein n=1 Tax=Colletotrichum karsti TaxID=1095194 RepID=A0A9P6HXZ7_9PEZI|nr:glycoside hydrolase family 16 protein [Colletotrichum karsti]KAF9872484.1 glycoside hydrolase family 16 protein [Colletotrichum karsti]
MFSSIVVAALLAVSPALALTRSPKPTFVNNSYVINDDARFAYNKYWNFTGTTLPDGLYKSAYTVKNGSGVDTHQFTTGNVAVSGGYLQLKVPGGQTKMPYTAGEVATTQKILYGSVRTVAIFSAPVGVCNGIFYYASDTQESDIEWLSDPSSLSNPGTAQVHFTNQDANGDGQSTTLGVAPPSNPTTTEHEYRFDWTEVFVRYYIDGTLIWETQNDVPSKAGPFILNNWSNGDKGWSVGPPKTAATFKIKDIDMYYDIDWSASKE